MFNSKALDKITKFKSKTNAFEITKHQAHTTKHTAGKCKKDKGQNISIDHRCEQYIIDL